VIRGSCLCGGVAFEVTGAVMPIQLCHAERCRKATGAAFAPELLAEASGFAWLRGSALVKTYEAPVLHEPPPYRRSFCEVCGSPLPCALEGTPFVMLHAGVLDDDPGTRPFRHVFVGQAACWHQIADELDQHDGAPPVRTGSA
jgi:hypothetical protein